MEHPIIIDGIAKPVLRLSFKNNLISQYLRTSAGRSQLASAMISPIRRSLNYQGIGRKALSIQPLPAGALSVYDKDIDIGAMLTKRFSHDIIKISGRGKAYNRKSGTRIYGARVVVPTFEIYSNPMVKISDVKSRRFDVIDRSVQKARQELMSKEDSMIFKALDQAGESKMDTEKVAKGIKVFGAVLFVVCLGLAIWSIFR